LKTCFSYTEKCSLSTASTNSLYLFDRNTKKIQKSLTANNENYKNCEFLKSEAGYHISDRVFDIKRTFDNVLDLGSSRAYVSKHLTKEAVKKIYLLDMSDKELGQAEMPEQGIEVAKINVDEEEGLPFENESLDLVYSNLSMHWVNDLPKLFHEVQRCLKKDCAFIGSMFAGDTLHELRVSLQLAELERIGGISAHISPMTTAQDIGGLLNSCGFNMLTLDLDEMTIAYPSIFELMYDLKDMGESNCLWNRSFNLSTDKLLATQSIYQELYGNTDKSIPATYQILNFIAWKPHESQKKPAKRGSGKYSLKDISKLDELVKNTEPKK